MEIEILVYFILVCYDYFDLCSANISFIIA